MGYASFMLTKYAVEEMNKHCYAMSYITGVTCINGTRFLTQYRIINLTKELWHAVDKANSESKKKRSVAALGNLQDFMASIKNQPSRWKVLKYSHMSHEFWEVLLLTWVSMQK